MRLSVLLLVLIAAALVGEVAAQLVSEARADRARRQFHCREFQLPRPPDEAALWGAAHLCQWNEAGGEIGFTPEACGCR